ncbi:helicase-exonuclease AddAB subunit AddA [Phosphitispora fastidiosa]|uniref:helicase-exonuclease AddAB subunit AddA n=1 Tax=Phosphitispora fastidiosa TaxID=2837202 RepID=UPI001E5801CB|nr:helicase-exonuclease AddAB subunit AddA [Phosphitispora fastidiosa]MBU7005381.1 ATP-dependent helicase/nuclease subunit A [Phosphitispora fastidiosa]
MSAPKWTPEQRDAITARGCNLLVSAAAGAGKTAVLVERIIRQVTDIYNPIDVDKLLVVTFTKAAAAEMRERISAAIARELNNNPDSLHLRRQLTLLNRASVTTLHSFCLDILRRYFYKTDLDPAFRIADDNEAALLRLEVLGELFEDCYENRDEEFLKLVDAYGGLRDDSFLQDMVLKLYEFSHSNPWPEEWLEGIYDKYLAAGGGAPEALDWGRSIKESVQLLLKGCGDILADAVRTASRPGGPAVYLQNLNDDILLVDDLLKAASSSWDALYSVINSALFSKLKPCKGSDIDEYARDKVKHSRDEVKKTVNRIRADFFSRPAADLTADLVLMAPLVKRLSCLTMEFRERYAKAKNDRSLVDFSDLEHYCLKILMDPASVPGRIIPSDAACEMQEYFTEVFVDEYQDTNEVQETILNLVSGTGENATNRFMVGDVKQCIYRFRLAEPDLFLEKYHQYPRSQGGPERGIDLTRNFRSRCEVVAAVNYIFRQLMSGTLDRLVYDQKAELVPGAQYPDCAAGVYSAADTPIEVYLLEKDNVSGDGDLPQAEELPQSEGLPQDGDSDSGMEYEPEDLDATQREARVTAKRIREMVLGKKDDDTPGLFVFDGKSGDYRPVRYRDIVVLLRTTRNTANVFLEEFRVMGIPAYADLGTGYFEAVEVETMMSLLRVIDNPRQDIPLAAVMRSPVVGLSADELAFVRTHDSKGDYYDAVQKCAASSTGIGIKLGAFLERLETWRTLARRGPLSDLIWRLLNETGYFAYVGGMPGGAQRQANLRALYDRSRQFEATSFRGLFRFLRFIERFRETGSDMGTAGALGENEDVVRIISIHKSKGLEFPVVFAAGLGKQFNTADLSKKSLLHKKMGLGLPVVDPELRLTYPTIAQHAIKLCLKKELLAEELRILYVALTRAREKLVLVGTVPNLARAALGWCETGRRADPEQRFLPETALMSARSYLDWIGPALSRHPDGAALRKISPETGDDWAVLADITRWEIIIPEPRASLAVLPETGCEHEQFMAQVRHLEPVAVEDRYGEFLENSLNWKYPCTESAGIPAKASVTEMKQRFAEAAEEAVEVDEVNEAVEAGSATDKETEKTTAIQGVRPKFLQRVSGLSAAEKGSAMHLVMQHLTLAEEMDHDTIVRQVQSMQTAGMLTAEQAAAVNITAVLKFFNGPLGHKMKSALRVKRELAFTMAVPVSEIYFATGDSDAAGVLGGSGEEKVIVQGVIDCLIEDADGYSLIDYKTDYIPPGGIAETAKKYQGQLRLYGMAVERILKRPVKEKYLYFFAAGSEVKC